MKFEEIDEEEESKGPHAWLCPMRAKYADDYRRDEDCWGCHVFGLCGFHATNYEVEAFWTEDHFK